MQPIDDPAAMTDDERFRQVAAILAAGVLRSARRSALEPKEKPESSKKQLAQSDEQSVTVRAG